MYVSKSDSALNFSVPVFLVQLASDRDVLSVHLHLNCMCVCLSA